jgi:DNA-binding NtrC family response regulator
MSAHILFRAGAQPAPIALPAAPVADEAKPIALDDRLRELESNLIGWALKISNGNKSRAAELLQIKRSTLGDRINRCGPARVGAVNTDQGGATGVIAERGDGAHAQHEGIKEEATS